jgi:LytS/YehU family sensor histidine kinase
MVEMEQMALRAQMNPHFIFNCLNSIQQYVFDQDVLAANKYISGFAKLIRATLQNSSHVYISLADELAYLSTYLELEKLRFKNKMNYSIKVDQSLSQDRIPIPAMILQPYIENSIRHGIRHKTDGQGHIQIKMDPIDGKLICTIEDNGIGREMAAQYKTKEHIEYQSKGMLLTADRIRLINNVYRDSIQVGVIDLKDEQGRATGTRIVIQFSLKDFSPQQNLFK